MKGKVYPLRVLMVPVICFASWFIYTAYQSPEKKCQHVEELKLPESTVAYRDNYNDLVRLDQKNRMDFLLGMTTHSMLMQEDFPYSSSQLDAERTQKILKILNDSSSYAWGEFGSPCYKTTLFYYDSTNQLIAYTRIDPLGEIENYPHRSLMKWGKLSSRGYKQMKLLGLFQ